jgi:branched-subunit amino acid aminotransferase/4-amino-4-deoxychorismate lyase
MGSGDSVWLNGKIVHRGAAEIPANDRGFLYGDGFFETTRILCGTPLFLDLHLARLAASCGETGFGWQPDSEELSAGACELVTGNSVRDGYLRITVSRGTHTGALTSLATAAPTVFIEARAMDLAPLDQAPPVVLARSSWRRNERSPLVGHKCLSYMENVLALADARQRGADEVYFLNSRDLLTEGAITNLFWVRDGTVHTPSLACGLLPGITRRVVLDLCARQGLPAREGEYVEADLATADEAFCTNSLRGIMAVRGLLDRPDARLVEGRVTTRLRRTYAEHAPAHCQGRARNGGT